MMTNRGGYTIAQALSITLHSEEGSDMDDSNILDAEINDISEPSDHSNIESAETADPAVDEPVVPHQPDKFNILILQLSKSVFV